MQFVARWEVSSYVVSCLVTGGLQGKNKDSVQGQVASVSGNAVQVTETSGTATVDLSPSAKVTEYSKAQVTDVANGNCVRVIAKPAPPPGGPATA